MSDPEGPGRRTSDVLDAIWDKVASRPERSDAATLLFRAKALDQLDVATEVDNQLPLVSRRSWLLRAYDDGAGFSCIARDITDLKRARTEVDRAARYSRSLIEASLDPGPMRPHRGAADRRGRW